MSKEKVIMGSFRAFEHAQDAIERIEGAGVAAAHISLVGPEDARDHLTRIDKQNKATEGAGIGGATGVALGGLAAGLTAVASFAAPGVGIIAAGPIVAALAGAGAGGAAGGAVGTLIGLGIPEHEAKFHTSVIKEGGYLVVVSSDDSNEQKAAKEILDDRSVKADSTKGTVART